MCGLCGVFGFISQDERRAFGSLQLFGQLRGRDSTGLAILPSTLDQPIKIFKELGGVEALVMQNKDAFDQRTWLLNPTINGRCFIGHHRHATSGSVDKESAHPFDLDNIVGCHNGTLLDYSIADLPSYSKDLIDSQVILKEIDTGKTLEEIIEYVKGAWALVWWNKSEQTLNMCRNDERGLHVAMTVDNRTLFWASESWMLDVALRRAGFNPDKFKILDTTPHKHLIWERNSKYKIELVDSLKAKAKEGIIGDWGEWGEWNTPRTVVEEERNKSNVVNMQRKRDKKTRRERVTSLKAKSSHEEEFIEVYARTFKGLYIRRREYEHLTRNGCSWCSVEDNVSWEHRESVVWYDVDQPVCEVCDTETSKVDAARKVH